MNSILHKQHALKALWIFSIVNVITLVVLFLMTKYYSNLQLSDSFEPIFSYISLNFPLISLLLNVGLFILFVINSRLLRSAMSKKKPHITQPQESKCISNIHSFNENKSHYFMLLDLSATATLTINDSQTIVQFNQAAQLLFGYLQEEVIGKPLTMLLPQDSRATHHKKVNNFGESAKSFTKLREGNQVKGLKKNGDIFNVDLDIAKVKITQENLFIASITDTTERIEQQRALANKSLELEQNNQQLQQYQHMLEELVYERTSDLAHSEDSLFVANQQLIDAKKMAALGEMVSSAAHEVNTPIGIGVTCASNLLEATTNINNTLANNTLTKSDLSSFVGVVEQSAKIILNNMERAAGLVHSFKAVSSDQVTDMQRVFKLHEYLEEILFSLNPKFNNTNHQISIECDDDIVVDSKPGALSQIITNLVINSLIHGFEFKDNGKIKIKVSQQDTQIIIAYQDDGKGLNLEQESRLFEPFYTTKKDEGGTGLGMHIVAELARNDLQGTIKVMPSDQGITFNLSFPCRLAIAND